MFVRASSTHSRFTYRLALPTSLCAGLLFSLSSTSYASTPGQILDQQTLQELAQKAEMASPREQCFLFAEVVNKMTDLASQQLAQGEEEKAAATLHNISQYADRIQMGVANDTRRLQKSEIILRETSRHLNDIMHAASGENRTIVQATLKRLSKVHTDLLAAVMSH